MDNGDVKVTSTVKIANRIIDALKESNTPDNVARAAAGTAFLTLYAKSGIHPSDFNALMEDLKIYYANFYLKRISEKS